MTDWQEIFRRRPDLAPPGYEEAAAATAKAWEEKEAERKRPKQKRGKKTKYPSLKHGAN